VSTLPPKAVVKRNLYSPGAMKAPGFYMDWPMLKLRSVSAGSVFPGETRPVRVIWLVAESAVQVYALPRPTTGQADF